VNMTKKTDSSCIRVFVADDHAIIREGIAKIIHETPDLVLAGQADSGHTVMERVKNEEWDVLILDLSLPGGGEATLQKCKQHRPDMPVIIFSMHPEDQYAIQLLREGAAAYLTKGRPISEIVSAIREVSKGKKYITNELAMQLLEHKPTTQAHDVLTPREKQIFFLILDGKQPSEIVKDLHLSPSTVSTHIQHIKKKLNANSIVELVKYAYRSGLID